MTEESIFLKPAEPGCSLNPEEILQFKQLEKTVEKGIADFFSVGMALEKIRDAKLYRDGYPTFGQYLWERWGFSLAHGYRLINASALLTTLKDLSPRGDIRLPKQEKTVRELLRIEDKKECLGVLQEAWALAGEKELAPLHIKNAAEKLGINVKAPSVKPKVRNPSALVKALSELEAAIKGGQPTKALLLLVAKVRRIIRNGKV